MKSFLTLLLALFISQSSIWAQTIQEKTKGITPKKGFFTIYPDEKSGKLFLQIDEFEKEFLYANFLVTGIGSNDLELDRGQIGDNRVVYFKRIGNKVLLIQPNLGYRAISDNPAEAKSVSEAFAQSVLGGFSIEAETKGSVLIDLTGFIVQDVHGVAQTLKRNEQGSYSMDASRSSLWLEVQKAFPDNVEMEALITLKGQPSGQQIRSVTPSAEFVSFRVRHSFVRLPDADFTPVESHPQGGYFGISYQDYATPIEAPLVKQFIMKHRLKKKNPGTAPSEAVEPIVYYVDSGAPEPVRSALIEGARWWNQAFEAAGFINAFQVNVLPDSADPLDVRYNVIQWVHRSTRGWSYGSAISDPRTGEIIKGHVSLGSLRVRQDYLIATGLLSPFNDGFDSKNNPMTELALARLRQLSAHEVGHTLGIQHNFAASVSNRASVMDYPHPYVTIKNGVIVFDDSYDTGIGEWDKQVVKFGYSDEGSAKADQEFREKTIQETADLNLQFISDWDARAQGGAHPQAHLWDNGVSASEELSRVLTIRKLALDRFNEQSIQQSMPMTTIQEVLVPLYYFHRYQTEATVKLIGGANYRYASRGDNETSVTPVSAKDQVEALQAILASMSPENLMLKKELLAQLNPRTPGYYDRRELFKGRTLPLFDPIAAAEAHIQQTANLLYHPARFERVTQQFMLDNSMPGVIELYAKPIVELYKSITKTDYAASINRIAAQTLLEELLATAHSNSVSIVAQNEAKKSLSYIVDEFQKFTKKSKMKAGDTSVDAIYDALNFIREMNEHPEKLPKRKQESLPPGSPIGSCGEI
ncbi:DUF5117 domain-containing protein [bacterium]|nr:MAG: DUF5117 domain-containing protein [bacterium]